MEGHPLEIERRLSDWALWTVNDGKIADRTTADRACDFYHRFEDDLELCRQLNLNCFRVSLNWPALCPEASEAGWMGEETVRYYRRLLQGIRDRGMKTFVTLFHFCLPNWIAREGGWHVRETVDAFGRYAELAARSFGDLVDYWLTVNEPLAYVYQGYVTGLWPPGDRKNYLGAFKAIRKLLEGHARAYHAIRSVLPRAKVSTTMHWRPFAARSRLNPLDLTARYFRDQVFNHIFPQAIERGELQFPFPMTMDKPVQELSGPVEGLAGSMDFLAVNYYARETCEFRPDWPVDLFGEKSKVARLETSDLGWEVFPEGLYYLLTEDLAVYRLNGDGAAREIFITENGFASNFPADLDGGDWSLEDRQRVRYLLSHLAAVHQAIADGANVKGYLHWSLTDNFEWAEGLRCRFGLVRVSYPTQERTLRRSAYIYADIARGNAVRAELLEMLRDARR